MSREAEETRDAAARARDLFERASAGLDHGMAFRLRRARHQAQAAGRTRTTRAWLPAAAMSALILAFAIGWWLPHDQPVDVTPLVAESDEIERLLTGEEDPELYAWLADAPVATARVASP